MTFPLVIAVLQQALQLFVLVGLVYAFNATLARRRPKLAYVLWMLVLVKAITPPIGAVGFSAWYLLPNAATGQLHMAAASGADQELRVLAHLPNVPSASFDSPGFSEAATGEPRLNVSLPVLLAVVWIVGVAWLAFIALRAYRRMSRSIAETVMESGTRISFAPARLVATLAIPFCVSVGQECRAASDCDVEIIKVKRVEIEDDKITIVAEASIGMVIVTPELPEDGRSRRFTGRHSTWIQIKADEATFTVFRPHPIDDAEFWEDMTMRAARDLKAGKEIGRIGYYRPDIKIKKNQVHGITGKAYIYPNRETAEPVTETKGDT